MRSLIVATGITGLATAGALMAAGVIAPLIAVLVWGTIVLAALAFERSRYKRLQKRPPGAGWARTTERFVDDTTGKVVTVYIESATGERMYVTE